MKKLIPNYLRNYLRFIKRPYYSLIRAFLIIITRRKIISGIFTGMDFNLPNFNTAMLIGTWELELKELFIKIFKKQYDDIICIGAAEGYYAVGFARKYPSANIHAFEVKKVTESYC